jgi:hypothetical protein
MSASPESELTPLTGLKNGIHCEINVTSHIARHFSEAVSLCAVRRAARTDLVLSEKRLSAVVQLRSLHWDIGDVLKPRQFLSRKSLLQPHSAVRFPADIFISQYHAPRLQFLFHFLLPERAPELKLVGYHTFYC